MAAKFTISFEHDTVNDIYVFYPCGHLATEADCDAWLATFDEILGGLKRRIDGIFVIEMFTLDEGLLDTFAKYRHLLHGRYTRHSVRVGTSGSSHRAMNSKVGLALDTPRDTAPDVATATAMILEARKVAARNAPT